MQLDQPHVLLPRPIIFFIEIIENNDRKRIYLGLQLRRGKPLRIFSRRPSQITEFFWRIFDWQYISSVNEDAKLLIRDEDLNLTLVRNRTLEHTKIMFLSSKLTHMV
jgi:hypothetical protein